MTDFSAVSLDLTNLSVQRRKTCDTLSKTFGVWKTRFSVVKSGSERVGGVVIAGEVERHACVRVAEHAVGARSHERAAVPHYAAAHLRVPKTVLRLHRTEKTCFKMCLNTNIYVLSNVSKQMFYI